MYFLAEGFKLPAIVSITLDVDLKEKLFEVLKKHKWIIAWTISDIKEISLSYCTHRILMEENFKSVVGHKSLNMKKVVKAKMIKLHNVGVIYLILDN